MALVNPPQLFTEGKVNLTNPYFNTILQHQAKKQARGEAIDKYYQNLPNTINDKGVRDQEIEGLNSRRNQIFEFGQKNKEALQNPKLDNGAARFNLDKMFREAQGYAMESKNRSATAMNLAKLRGNPKYDYIFRDPKLIEQIDAHEKPVDDPNSKAINFDQLTLPQAPFDPQKYLKGFGDIKYDYKTSTAPNPQDKYTLIETKTPQLGQDAKEAIYHRATEALIDNPSFEDHIKKALDQDPSLIGKIQDTFKENYGRDINPATADHDIAAAFTILGLSHAGSRGRTIPNTEARTEDRMKLQDHAAWLRYHYKNKDKEEQTKSVDSFIDDQIKNAAEVAPGFGSGEFGGTKVYEVKTTPTVKQIFAKKDKDGYTIYPEKVIYLGDDKFRLTGKGYGETFTRPEYKAALTKGLFNSNVKLNQISEVEKPKVAPSKKINKNPLGLDL